MLCQEHFALIFNIMCHSMKANPYVYDSFKLNYQNIDLKSHLISKEKF